MKLASLQEKYEQIKHHQNLDRTARLKQASILFGKFSAWCASVDIEVSDDYTLMVDEIGVLFPLPNDVWLFVSQPENNLHWFRLYVFNTTQATVDASSFDAFETELLFNTKHQAIDLERISVGWSRDIVSSRNGDNDIVELFEAIESHGEKIPF